MNVDQDIFVVASTNDGRYMDIRNKREVDMDVVYELNWLRDVIYDDDMDTFYVLANKLQGKKGIFLLRIRKDEETQECQGEFVLRFGTDLEIGDCSISVFFSREPQKQTKEIVLCYKTIYINTLSVMCIDISGHQMNMIFRHESFQLWGQRSYGFLLDEEKDIVNVSPEGISVLDLGLSEITDKRII